MAEKKSEQIKIYITIGLAVVLVISGYFRLIHAKTKKGRVAPTPQPSLAPINIPRIQTEPKQDKKQPKPDRSDFLQSAVRDIFAEPADPEPEKNKSKEKPKPPPMSLKGTIVGGKTPIAIINGRFARVGDRIGDYQVTQITKDEVRLISGSHEIVLKVLKHVHN